MANLTGKGGFQKGKSGNPGGRPKKDREFTELLERRGAQTLEVDGKRVASKRLLVDMVWDAILTGAIKFTDGSELKMKPLYWIETVKWLYAQIDGPPKQNIELSGSEDSPVRVSHGLDVAQLTDDELAFLEGIITRLTQSTGTASGTGAA